MNKTINPIIRDVTFRDKFDESKLAKLQLELRRIFDEGDPLEKHSYNDLYHNIRTLYLWNCVKANELYIELLPGATKRKLVDTLASIFMYPLSMYNNMNCAMQCSKCVHVFTLNRASCKCINPIDV
jgi:hypothetical protein